ncbi:MAG: response regulator [Spirochaetia bacterium]|nr:response regulator [Spirochaetia bacterium]
MSDNNLILVVDDNRILCADVKAILNEAGYSVEARHDAASAQDFLRNHPHSVSLMLLDWMLPGQSGLQLLEHVKRQSEFKFLPVIMLTGRSTLKDITDGIAAGALYYITKPFETRTLKALVTAALADFDVTREEDEAPRNALLLLENGTFAFKTLEQAGVLAFAMSLLCPDPGAARLGLHELLVNAVEHGNLEITHEEKGSLLSRGVLKKEIESRLANSSFADRLAHLSVEVLPGRIEFQISDQGHGFDYGSFLSLTPERAFREHGRGIAIARQLSFDGLQYAPPGNAVRATILTRPQIEHQNKRRYDPVEFA